MASTKNNNILSKSRNRSTPTQKVSNMWANKSFANKRNTSTVSRVIKIAVINP